MITVSRSRREAIRRSAAQIRERCLCTGQSTENTANAIADELPEVSRLEAWRLALGWSRAETIARVGDFYLSRGLMPPAMTQPMLCRWEHGRVRWPSDEYAEALCTVYGARPEQLDLDRWRVGPIPAAGRYSADAVEARDAPEGESGTTMTTAAGLPAVRESLDLALLIDPTGSRTVVEAAESAIEFYALGYSKHPPATLFDEVHRVRGRLAKAVTTGETAEGVQVDMRRSIGWLSALLGNLAHHLNDQTGARVHLATAYALGERCRDNRLAAWACGAQAMVARARGELTEALDYADRGLACAPRGLPRAQLHGWAQLPTLAALQRPRDADRAMADAARALESDPIGYAPGRFGYDEAEHRLHQAEADRVLVRADKAIAAAEASLRICVTGTPSWAAASLTLAQAEAPGRPDDAAQRALSVLEEIPPARLRSTTRTRLVQLDGALAEVTAAGVADLRERVRLLRPAIDVHGVAESA
ncbi:helix-turn-helix domain-containing protein [Streptomyces prunicolor]|uniref:helix-turn-helix domain-containing protein n=1 Tax=Streptomyces prunicolor TaxID=67348 RepID=UPI00036E2BF7|nr:helix-turn-helix transcriptional regulator [Streptomyces prunicolor]